MTEKRDRAIALLQDAQRRWADRQGRDPPLTDDDIREITAAIGADATFAALPPDDKDWLFRRVLRCRRVVEGFNLADEERAEDPDPLMSGLRRIVAVIPKSPALLTAIAIEMGRTRGTSFEEELFEMAQLADRADLMLEIGQKVLAKPKHFDRRRLRTMRRQLEAFLLCDALERVGIPVPRTGKSGHGRPPSPALALAGRLVAYTSGEKNVTGYAIRKRLYQYFRSRRAREQTKKKVS